MQKILVIGSGGAGKSTFSILLGKALDIDVIHLDSLYWKPGWIEPDKEEWKRAIQNLLVKESWIMDGNYSGTLAERIQRCDAVIFLDFPRVLCAWRVLKRAVIYVNRNRPEMPLGCNERMNLDFIKWVWNYPTRSRPKVVSLLEKYKQDKTILIFTTPREAQKFLDAL